MSSTITEPPTPHRTLARRLASGTVWAVVGRLASVGSLLGLHAVLRRALDEGDYAAYALASATAIFLGIPASLGLPKILLRTLRDPRAVATESSLRRTLASALSLAPAGILGATALLWACSVAVDGEPKWRGVLDHVWLTSLWMGGLVMSLVLSHALQGLDRYLDAAVVGARGGGVIANVLALIACAALWTAGALSLPAALAAQVVANLASTIYGAIMLNRVVVTNAGVNFAADGHDGNSGRIDLSRRWFLRESVPNLFVQLTSTGIAQTEMLLMGLLANEQNIADYNLVIRLMELLAAAHILATGIVAPFVAELYSRGELRKLEMLLRGLASLVALPTTILATAYMAAPDFVLTTLFGRSGDSAAPALRIATVAAAISCYAGANALTLVMTGRQRTLLRASAAAAVCYLLIAPPLIHFSGASGAAAATLLVFGTYNVVITLVVRWQVGVWTAPALRPEAWAATIRLIRQRLSARGGRRVGPPPTVETSALP